MHNKKRSANKNEQNAKKSKTAVNKCQNTGYFEDFHSRGSHWYNLESHSVYLVRQFDQMNEEDTSAQTVELHSPRPS